MAQTLDLPGDDLDVARMPGHWLLARLGKRVLRPGGLRLTEVLLDGLAIRTDDEVVEFAPGLGVTARMIMRRGPRSYVGVERDARAARWAASKLPINPKTSVVVGQADRTTLPSTCASVIVGEAMLSMNTAERQRLIVSEAFRLLQPGGRYGIHELAVVPDNITADQRRRIDQALSSMIHVGAHPLPAREWKSLLEGVGFSVVEIGYAPMHLLRPMRLLQDEGILGVLRIVKNLAVDPTARRRVLAMRWLFERYRRNLSAIYIVARKDHA